MSGATGPGAPADANGLSVHTGVLRDVAGDGGLGAVVAALNQVVNGPLTQDLEFTVPSVTAFTAGTDLDTAYRAALDALVRGPSNAISTLIAQTAVLRKGLTQAANVYDAAHQQHMDTIGALGGAA